MLIWLAAFGLVLAQKVGLKSTLGFGCWSSAFNYDFGCPIEMPYYCRCANDNFLATAFACVYLYGKTPEEIDAGYDYIQSQCHYWGNRTLTPQEMDFILITRMEDIIDEGSIQNGTLLETPVFTGKQLFKQQYKGAKEARLHYILGSIFGGIILGYWLLIHVGMIAAQMFKLAAHDALDRFLGVKFVNWWRHYFTLPPAVGRRHHVPHKVLGIFTIKAPTRGQSIIVFGFLVINIVSLVCYFDTDSSDKPLVFVTNSHKMMRYMANRCAIIAFSMCPLIVLFASRNNPLISLTGWSYDTFQMYHRWCARMMVMHGFIHGVLLTWYSAEEHVLMFKWHKVHNWPAGNVALYCCLIMLFFAVKSVRNRIYEVFVFVHKFCFLVILVALFVHCSDYGWLPWLYSTMGIYVVEYMARLTKQIKSGWIQEVEFSLASEDMYRVRTKKKREWVFSAGQYAYVRVLDRHLFWQEHPFSLFKGSDNRIEFMCKAKAGATRTILEKLKAAPGNKLTLKAIIEGPYGREHNLQAYGSVFILAGGVGITAMYSYILNMAHQVRDKRGRITLVWVLQSVESLWAFNEEVAQLNKVRDLVNIQIYLTRAQPDKEEYQSIFSSSTECEEIIYHGRPQVDIELGQFISEASGDISICACGPPSFVDSTRDTIVKNIRASQSLIHYFEEAFSW